MRGLTITFYAALASLFLTDHSGLNPAPAVVIALLAFGGLVLHSAVHRSPADRRQGKGTTISFNGWMIRRR